MITGLRWTCRSVLLIVSLSFWATPILGVQKSSYDKAEIELLVKHLQSKSWPAEDLRKLFSSPAAQKMSNMVTLNVTKPVVLKATSYAHFAEPAAIERAFQYYSQWSSVLNQAAERFKVDPEVIVSILLVETNLGTFTGNYNLLSVYPSVFVDSYKLLQSAKVSKDTKLKARIERKKEWSLNQLRAMLAMQSKKRVDLSTLKGSYAGAIGISQFLPSSYLTYAVSSTSGPANLFNPPDAILSVANYLKKHGYKWGHLNTSNRKAIYGYNHSDVYVNIVLKAAQNLRSRLAKALPVQSHH